MSLQTEKLKLIQLLINTENQVVIDQIKAIFKSANQKDIWEELTEVQQLEINNAIEESLSGQTIGYDEFINKHRK